VGVAPIRSSLSSLSLIAKHRTAIPQEYRCSPVGVDAFSRSWQHAPFVAAAAGVRDGDLATAHGKFAGLGGDRDVARQVHFIRRGVKFMTTQTDIGFLMAEASRRTGELRKALAGEAG